MEHKHSFLGTGWSFPPEFSKEGGSVKLVAGEEDIAESLRILLSTRPGERVMLPAFGCNLDELLFNPLNLTLKTYVADQIKTAILYHEPRVDVHRIDIANDSNNNGLLLISIDYTIRSTNSRKNMVYPYYKAEGTEI